MEFQHIKSLFPHLLLNPWTQPNIVMRLKLMTKTLMFPTHSKEVPSKGTERVQEIFKYFFKKRLNLRRKISLADRRTKQGTRTAQTLLKDRIVIKNGRGRRWYICTVSYKYDDNRVLFSWHTHCSNFQRCP